MLDVLTIGDEMLRTNTKPIKTFGGEIRLLADAMVETMHAEDGIGLAGPQVGVLKRIFVTHVSNDEPRVYINPEILESSEDAVEYEEGCLSVPGVYAPVARPSRVKVQAQDVEGKVFTLNADGLLARVIQHEYDHLRGVLFVDRLDEETRNRVLEVYKRRSRKYKGR